MPQKLELPPALADRITALFQAGQSRRKIATALQEGGYKVPLSRYNIWHHSLISMCLVQLGLVPPPRPSLKPGVLGEGAQRWEEMLTVAAANGALAAGQGTVSTPAGAGPPPASLDVDEVAAGWEHALARASTPPAESSPAAGPQPQPAGGNGPPKPPPPPAAASAQEPGGQPSLDIAVDGLCTPADRRLWFSLVRVARPELGRKPSHDLPRAQALALLTTGSTAPGPADLWGAMKRLRASGITWEARFDGRPLLITTPLISGVLTTTVLTFHFSPELVTLLLDDAQFARLRALLGREHDPPPAAR